MYLQKCGFGQALTNKANQELSTEERATKCVGPTATGTEAGCAGLGEWPEPIGLQLLSAQGSSRLEAKQALQFSTLELTDSQFISFKKTTVIMKSK